jgi:diketogulonate reductase-like aldo/keto reductase
MSERKLTIDHCEVPRVLYGTAWKEERTQELVELALRSGFRGIDTANQRRHYHEAAVGKAISAAIADGLVVRENLFLQTKFTFRRGQDHRLPYDPTAPIRSQVEQSFDSSIEHLSVETIDSYVLHGPASSAGLTPDDWAAWQSMESIHDSGRVGLLGVSNVSFDQLQSLCAGARIRPTFVQNRCYASSGWDRQVRQFCKSNGIVYQGFSLLTANRNVLASSGIKRIALDHGRTIQQIVFRFATEVGMIPLTGTTSGHHMQADLDIFDFHLSRDEIEQIEQMACS